MRFPRGKISQEDEGQTVLALTVMPDKKTLVINFGKPIAWIGFGTAELDALIDGLKAKRATMISATRADME